MAVGRGAVVTHRGSRSSRVPQSPAGGRADGAPRGLLWPRARGHPGRPGRSPAKSHTSCTISGSQIRQSHLSQTDPRLASSWSLTRARALGDGDGAEHSSASSSPSPESKQGGQRRQRGERAAMAGAQAARRAPRLPGGKAPAAPARLETSPLPGWGPGLWLPDSRAGNPPPAPADNGNMGLPLPGMQSRCSESPDPSSFQKKTPARLDLQLAIGPWTAPPTPPTAGCCGSATRLVQAGREGGRRPVRGDARPGPQARSDPPLSFRTDRRFFSNDGSHLQWSLGRTPVQMPRRGDPPEPTVGQQGGHRVPADQGWAVQAPGLTEAC